MNGFSAEKELHPEDFWAGLDRLIETCPLIIDRPRGSTHPRYRDLVYPLDYGYLEGTSAGDGGGIDVWLGSMGLRRVTGIVCTVDGKKRDAEIKILLDCAEKENRLILDFLNRGSMRAMLIERGDGFARAVLPERPVR